MSKNYIKTYVNQNILFGYGQNGDCFYYCVADRSLIAPKCPGRRQQLSISQAVFLTWWQHWQAANELKISMGRPYTTKIVIRYIMLADNMLSYNLFYSAVGNYVIW
jgi:hypothetical protein